MPRDPSGGRAEPSRCRSDGDRQFIEGHLDSMEDRCVGGDVAPRRTGGYRRPSENWRSPSETPPGDRSTMSPDRPTQHSHLGTGASCGTCIARVCPEFG